MNIGTSKIQLWRNPLPLRSYLFSVQVKTTNKCAAGQKFVQWATVPKMHVLYKLNLHTSDSIAAMVFVFE